MAIESFEKSGAASDGRQEFREPEKRQSDFPFMSDYLWAIDSKESFASNNYLADLKEALLLVNYNYMPPQGLAPLEPLGRLVELLAIIYPEEHEKLFLTGLQVHLKAVVSEEQRSKYGFAPVRQDLLPENLRAELEAYRRSQRRSVATMEPTPSDFVTIHGHGASRPSEFVLDWICKPNYLLALQEDSVPRLLGRLSEQEAFSMLNLLDLGTSGCESTLAMKDIRLDLLSHNGTHAVDNLIQLLSPMNSGNPQSTYVALHQKLLIAAHRKRSSKPSEIIAGLVDVALQDLKFLEKNVGHMLPEVTPAEEINSIIFGKLRLHDEF